MASMQCHKPATNEACPKTCHNKPASESSLGQKVSGFLKGHHGSHSSSHTQYSATATNGQGHHATNGTVCHGRTKKKGEHRNKKTGGGRNLLQKIKDGISGHSSTAATARATRKAAAERRTKLSSCGRSSIPIDHYDQQNERGLKVMINKY